MAQNEQVVDPRHPAYLLRRDLVRIIGNLAYNNKASQDTVGYLGYLFYGIEMQVPRDSACCRRFDVLRFVAIDSWDKKYPSLLCFWHLELKLCYLGDSIWQINC
jgi:hypothetical protein